MGSGSSLKIHPDAGLSMWRYYPFIVPATSWEADPRPFVDGYYDPIYSTVNKPRGLSPTLVSWKYEWRGGVSR